MRESQLLTHSVSRSLTTHVGLSVQAVRYFGYKKKCNYEKQNN